MRYNAFSGMCDLHHSGIGDDYIRKVLRRPGWRPRERLLSESDTFNQMSPPMKKQTEDKQETRIRRHRETCRLCGRRVRNQSLCGWCKTQTGWEKGNPRYVCPRCGQKKNRKATVCRTCFDKQKVRGPHDKG